MAASRFTPEVRGALVERAAAGVSLRDSCRAIGLREGTAKGWVTRGRREGTGDYAEFAAALEQARDAARSRPEPMDEAELAREVSQMVRAGSVAAAKLRWEMLRSTPGEVKNSDDDALAEVDELARLRRAG
jgi:hypothetical protein